MASVFTPLTPELPSTIVDRVYLKVTTLGDADFLTLFGDAAGTAGGAIRMLQRVDPKYEPGKDPLPGLMLWGLRQGSRFEVGGGRFLFSVGWRMVLPAADRYRASGEACAMSLVWKLHRVLWNNQKLTDAAGQNDITEKIESFQAVVNQGIEYEDGSCVDLIEGDVVYETLLSKGDI